MGLRKKRMLSFITIGIVILLAFLITATTLMYQYSEYMDNFLGSGQSHTVSSSGLSTEYIEYSTSSTDEALAYAQEVTRETAEEGIILLRNDDDTLPLKKNSSVTLLGYYTWHNNMSGGEDPASTDGAISFGVGLEDFFDVNSSVTSVYNSRSGEIGASSIDSTITSSMLSGYDDVAIITIERNSGEGNDQSTGSANIDGYEGKHGLALTDDELALIDFACDNFGTVIMVINSANTFELNWLDPDDDCYDDRGYYTDPYSGNVYNFSKIKAAVWAGCCGSQGGIALGEILCGDVNPSGHTPDTYARVLTDDPTYVNFGNFKYANSSSLNSYSNNTYFVEYEEDIYVGYRFYETAAYEAARGNYDGYDYDSAVVYPFGYGLSYTTFSYEYVSHTYDKDTDAYTFEVKITNTGDVAGKGVAQIYVSQPYEDGQVEKAHVQLVGYAKSETLSAGASETVTIEVSSDYFTSYDYTDNKCYILDEGDYKFYLSENSHSWAEIDEMNSSDQSKLLWTHTREAKIYNDENDGKRTTDETTATNKMDDSLNYKFTTSTGTGDGLIHDMSRSDFAGTMTTAPTDQDYYMTNENALEQVDKYSVWTEGQTVADYDMPVTDSTETSWTLADMRGVDIDDEKWDEYISQFSVESMATMYGNGGWNELSDSDNGVPTTYDCDSPYGLYAFQLTISNVNKWYCGAPMIAATFNDEIASKVGDAMAEEAWNQKQSDGMSITGLYGFGLNIHRSAFGGRNYEYYSEDPVLSGKMAASAASSASEKGLITFFKHFALNEQELNRQNNGYCSYVNEQAFREIYVRAYEIYMKEAKMTVNYYQVNEETGEYEMVSKEMSAATGLMTAYNRIGATYAGASNSINDILRDEFGFTGTIVTDAGGQPSTYMNSDQALRAGGNLCLTNNGGTNGLYDYTSATAVTCLQQSTKYLLYNKANSNALQGAGLAPGDGIYYDMSPWQYWIIAAWVVGGVAIAGGITTIVLLLTDKLKLKEKYKKKDIYDTEWY